MKLAKHVRSLLDFLNADEEKANEDLAIEYFRHHFGKAFTRQKEAQRADGYVPGQVILELKGAQGDWLSGFFQAIAYSSELDATKIVVACNQFLAIWKISDIPIVYISECHELRNSGKAASEIGATQAKKYKSKSRDIELISKAILQKKDFAQKSILDNIFIPKLNQFEAILLSEKDTKKIRITIKNFKEKVSLMRDFFDEKKPLLAVRAFYSLLYSWKEGIQLSLHDKRQDAVTVSGTDPILGLKPDTREKFIQFVKNHVIDAESSRDEFFAHYDKALDAADPKFRISNGIFFTDLDLSRFAMWLVKHHLGDIGDKYLVIDPACGSGNLVTNWKSPLELRHKVVSEIEPELLFAIEKRMKGDEWHNGKFTVIPKVDELKGLNFLDKSASEYLGILRGYLEEKGINPDKPLAFLCNPPYRNDDDQTAGPASYKISNEIVNLIGNECASERYSCFLAQMKLICSQAEENGIPGNSLLMVFTPSTWFTNRPGFKEIRKEIFGSFQNKTAILVNGKEFFDLKGKFPIAFSVWEYQPNSKNLDATRPMLMHDLTWLKKRDLEEIDWSDIQKTDISCRKILNNPLAVEVALGTARPNIKVWSGTKMLDFKKSRTKKQIAESREGGLPLGDKRLLNRKTYGVDYGLLIGFMDDLTPCRVEKSTQNAAWFHLDQRFMRSRAARCLSGPPDNRGYCAFSLESAKKTFIWFAIGRTFASEGYPMWVDALEMWAPKITENLLSLAFAIGFAENECVKADFPANNPIKNAPQICVFNPMTPLRKDSFWNKVMASEVKSNSEGSELVAAVQNVYNLWKKELAHNSELKVSYQKQYFIGKGGSLDIGAGLVQINDYATELNQTTLLSAISGMKDKLSEAKKLLHKKLLDPNDLNYFGATPSLVALNDEASAAKMKILKLQKKISASKKTTPAASVGPKRKRN